MLKKGVMKMNLSFIDLFAGCGGFSLGFRNAGLNENGFVEFWHPAINTHSANFPDALHIGTDITKIADSKISKFSGKADVIIGGPPCQGFSIAGNRDSKDSRNSLFMEFVRFCRIIQPKIFVFENVIGLLSMRTASGEPVKRIIRDEFSKIGYSISAQILNAENYGVPQSRQRVIFIGNRMGKENIFPKPEKSCISVRQAIGNLPFYEIPEIQHVCEPLHGKVKKIAPFLKENEYVYNWKSSNYRTEWNNCSHTLTKSGRYLHPRFNRYLSVREHARLSSFPDSFKFCGSLQEMYGQIGNAVPPKLAEAIAKSIKAML